ncbi:hypothetical protein SI65_03010 [Aspergillus cristatus]|uniref:Uncharacterized protein n=1 Tax=Aspergillus cristatus TaxID=573508 RepID=A0A1E3BMG6_ASPCR|nr:hypothetical protein SI65_03010 [Aspergillus cristatus]
MSSTFSRALLPLTLSLNLNPSIAARAATHFPAHSRSLAFSPSIFHPQCPTSLHSYSTMSDQSNANTQPQQGHQDQLQQQTQGQEQPQEQQQQQPYLALPESSSSSGTNQLDLSQPGSTVTLDHLGPMVVNTDGTLSRIANWEGMAEIERKTTLRVLGKRNKQRLEALKAAGVGVDGQAS